MFKRRHHRLFLGRFHPPCTRPTFNSGSASFNSSQVAPPPALPVIPTLQSTYKPSTLTTFSHAGVAHAVNDVGTAGSGIATVVTGVRPGGSSSITEYRDRHTQSLPACGGSAWRSYQLMRMEALLLAFLPQCQTLCTPKRCCSSIITSARPLNCTVPGRWRVYRQSSAPDRWRWLLLCQPCFTFLLTGEPAHFDPSGANQLRKLLACCSASNSVVPSAPPVCRAQLHAARRGRHQCFTGAYIALHQTHHRHIQAISRSISATTRA